MSTLTPKKIRRVVGWSRKEMARIAGVSESTLRLFEANPEEIADERRRRMLLRMYDYLAESEGLSQSA